MAVVVLAAWGAACEVDIVDRARETAPPAVAGAVRSITSPCVADVQGLGGYGYGWLGLRTDKTVWKGSPARLVSELADEVEAISDVDGESLHHCAIKTDGSLWCWGLNLHGQCGGGDTTPEISAPIPVLGLPDAVVEVSVSARFTCARLVDNSVWCWGSNIDGQIGTGSVSALELTPRRVEGLPTNVSRISAGYDHVCVIAGTDLWCWGGNLYGQIGAGDFSPPAELHLTPELVMTNIAKLSAGGFFTCVIDLSAQAYCWGDNESGHLGLGLGDTANRNVPTLVPALDDMADIDAGVRSACGLKNDGSVWCWGFQGRGRLGDGVYALDNTTQREEPQPVLGPLGEPGGATAIRFTEGAGCAIATDGSLWCWGWGTFLDGGTETATPVEVDLCNLPMMTELSPAAGSTLGGTHVVISGDAFQDGATVEFGAEPGTNVMFVSADQLEVDAPAYWPSVQDVKVTNPDGTVAILYDAFEFVPPPAAWLVLPAKGPIAGGVRVTVHGSRLRDGVVVSFDGIPATDAAFVDDGVEVTLPAHEAGVVEVTVENPDGQRADGEVLFTYVEPPTPESLDFTSGPPSGGTRVVITGKGFDWTSVVYFDDIAASSITYVDPQTIAAYTPPHEAAVVDVTVTNEDGQSGTLADAFTYGDGGGDGGGGDGGGGDGGCGCATSGRRGAPGPLVLLVIGLVVARRRRAG